MDNLIILVGIEDSDHAQPIYSLVFTKVQDHHQARQIAAYHIYHLHANDQHTLKNPESVRFNKNTRKAYIKKGVMMTAEIVAQADVKTVHKLGQLRLFGYAKKLRKIEKKYDFVYKN